MTLAAQCKAFGYRYSDLELGQQAPELGDQAHFSWACHCQQKGTVCDFLSRMGVVQPGSIKLLSSSKGGSKRVVSLSARAKHHLWVSELGVRDATGLHCRKAGEQPSQRLAASSNDASKASSSSGGGGGSSSQTAAELRAWPGDAGEGRAAPRQQLATISDAEAQELVLDNQPAGQYWAQGSRHPCTPALLTCRLAPGQSRSGLLKCRCECQQGQCQGQCGLLKFPHLTVELCADPMLSRVASSRGGWRLGYSAWARLGSSRCCCSAWMVGEQQPRQLGAAGVLALRTHCPGA
jgi:hypothetical protein